MWTRTVVILLCIVLEALIALPVAWADQSESMARLQQAAKEAQEKGAYDVAVTLWTQFLQLDPTSAEAHGERGDAYLARKDYTRAIDDYAAVLASENSSSVVFKRGVCYYYTQKYGPAIKDLSQFIRQRPSDTGAYFWRARAYADSGEHDAALKDYTIALELNPNDFESYNARGNVYFDTGAYDKAIKDYDAAIRLAPREAALYGNRGNAYEDKQDYDQAIKDYTSAMELANKEAGDLRLKVLVRRGTLYAQQADYQNAVKDLSGAVALDPDQPRVCNNLAWVLATSPTASTRDGQKALQYASKAHRLEPHNANTMGTLAAAHAELRNYAEAIKWARKALDAPDKLNRQGLEQIRAELKLFEAGKPYRVSP